MRKWPSFTLSQQLALATNVAKVFMLRRKATRLGIRDFVAGAYVAHKDKISRYWKSGLSLDRMAEDCGVVDPPWVYQQEFYRLMIRKKSPVMNHLVLYDEEFSSVLMMAKDLAKRARHSQEHPNLTVEHVLLAIRALPNNPVCDQIARSGLSITLLKKGRP